MEAVKKVWKNCGSAICGTPLDIERGAYRELENDYVANIYITKPCTFEWSDNDKYLVTYFESIDGDIDRRNEKTWKCDTEDEAIELIKKEFGIDLNLKNYR